MSWIDAINAFGEENAGAFTAMSGVGGAASVVSFFKTLNFQKDVMEDLAEIKQSLNRIERNTEFIIDQNKQILSKLDQLPTRFEVNIMLRHAVQEGFLKRAYSDLNAAMNDVQEHWTSNSPNWISYRDSLQFCFDHDNAISSTAELLTHCNFSYLITKTRAKQFLSTVLNKRREKLVMLAREIKGETTATLKNLRLDLLGDSTYVAKHNFTDSLVDLSTIDYTIKGDQYYWVDGPCLVEDRQTGFCWEPGAPIRRIDRQFRLLREKHKAAIESQISASKKLNEELGEITVLIKEVSFILQQLEFTP